MENRKTMIYNPKPVSASIIDAFALHVKHNDGNLKVCNKMFMLMHECSILVSCDHEIVC